MRKGGSGAGADNRVSDDVSSKDVHSVICENSTVDRNTSPVPRIRSHQQEVSRGLAERMNVSPEALDKVKENFVPYCLGQRECARLGTLRNC